MKDQYNLKLVELKLSRQKTLLHFTLWPFIAVISLLIALLLQNKIKLPYTLAMIFYLFYLYAFLLVIFARKTRTLIKKEEVKK